MTTKQNDKSAETFLRLYYAMHAFYATDRESYEASERHHLRAHGKRKYSSFDSFRVMRDRKLKQNKSKQ